MISKNTYKGKACNIALGSRRILVDDPGRLARGQSLLRSAKRNACEFALDARKLAPEGEDYDGLYLLNDGVGTDLSLQVEQADWFPGVLASEAGQKGFMVVFPLDTKIYIAIIDVDGVVSTDLVVSLSNYAKTVSAYLKTNVGSPIYRVPSEGAAVAEADLIHVSQVAIGSFEIGSGTTLEVFDKRYRLKGLTFLMVTSGYWHAVYIKLAVVAVILSVAYGYYGERQTEINLALERAAVITKQQQDNLFTNHVDWSGSKRLVTYVNAYAALEKEGVRRDAMISLYLNGLTLEAKGIMTIAGTDDVPAQANYPDLAYSFAESRDDVFLTTGTSRDGWSMLFRPDLKSDMRPAIDWYEDTMKKRLMGIARATFSEITLLDESVLSTSPNIYELNFTLQVTNASAVRLKRIADYFYGTPVSVESVKCEFGSFLKPVGCLIVGSAAYLL